VEMARILLDSGSAINLKNVRILKEYTKWLSVKDSVIHACTRDVARLSESVNKREPQFQVHRKRKTIWLLFYKITTETTVNL
jgi:histone H3/H4